MSTLTILYFAIAVFTLMMIGVLLTAREYRRMSKESAAKEDAEGHS